MIEFKEIFEKLKVNKKLKSILIILLIGIFMVAFSSPAKKDSNVNENKDVYADIDKITKETEKKLKKLLLKIDGVEKVEVMICFSDAGSKEYYKDEIQDYDEDKIKTDTKVVFKRSDGNEVPVLKREIYPQIKGVTVVADATNKNAHDLIFNAVKASLGVDSHKIEIIINDRSK